MKATIAVIISLLSLSIFAIEFEDGNYFEENKIRGTVNATCDDLGRTRTVFYQCRGSYLEPGNFSKLVIPSNIEADKVRLSYTNTNGSQRTKITRVKDGLSRPVNLWVNTLTQRALLKRGENEINYTLTNDNQVVDEGTFYVTVDSLPIRTCMHGYIRTFTSCSNISTICHEYFRRYNYCQ